MARTCTYAKSIPWGPCRGLVTFGVIVDLWLVALGSKRSRSWRECNETRLAGHVRTEVEKSRGLASAARLGMRCHSRIWRAADTPTATSWDLLYLGEYRCLAPVFRMAHHRALEKLQSLGGPIWLEGWGGLARLSSCVEGQSRIGVHSW